MATPVGLNAPVSREVLAGLPTPAATVLAPGAPIVVADLPAQERPDVTQAPASPDRLPAPAPGRRTVRTPADAAPTQTETPYRVNNISTAEAERAVTESQRVLRRLSGVGFGTAPYSFQPALVFKDQLGETHVRLQRIYRGIPVFGEQVITHMDRTGNVRDLTNAQQPENLNVDIVAQTTAAQATTVGLQAFGATPQTQATPQLVIVRDDDGTYRLAWHLIMMSLDGAEPRRMHYFVDAQSNQLIFEYNEIHGIVPDYVQERIAAERGPAGLRFDGPRADGAPAPAEPTPLPAPAPTPSSETPAPAPTEPAPAPAPPPPPPYTAANGLGTSLYAGNVALQTARRNADGLWTLRDPSRRNTETRDANGANNTGAFDAEGFPAGARPITDTDNAWGTPTDDVRSRPAVDAQYHGERYDDYLRDFYGRSGIDGAGLPNRQVVHVGRNMVNAFYYNGVMWYGDGDARNAGPLVDKDVAGHEPTHGLTANTSGLIYRNESGALNEAASDIIGSAGYSWYLRNWALPAEQRDQGIPSDFLIGEDCWTPGVPGDALRYMADPTRDRRGTSDSYSRDNYAQRYRGFSDNGGVHLNSGIANNFFSLLAVGGTNRTSGQTIEQGVGMEKALRIFYRAHTTYFTPFTTFAQAREGSIRAAADLYGADSVEAATVSRAWNAVGVEAPLPAPTTQPAPTPAPTPPTSPAPTPPVSLRRRAA